MKNHLLLLACLLCTVPRLNAQMFAGSYANTAGGVIETVNLFTFAPQFGMPATEASATLDLNHDGQPDLKFLCLSDAAIDNSGGGTGLTTLHPNVACMADGNHFVRRLVYGQPIDGGQTWEAANSPLAVNFGLLGGPYTAGNWLSNPEGYAGVRLIEGNDTLYGWLQIQAYVWPAGNTTLIVQTWALQAPDNNKPPAPFIIAGSMAGLVPGNQPLALHIEDIPAGASVIQQDSMDLNEDGIFDVALRSSLQNTADNFGSSNRCIALHAGFTFAVEQNDPRRFSTNDSIPAAGLWNLSALPLRHGPFSSYEGSANDLQTAGAWLNPNSGYLGFRLVTPESDTLLGWMHVLTFTVPGTIAHLEVDAWAIEHDPRQAPYAKIGVTPEKAVYCAGDTVTFHAETLGAQSVVWQFWDGATGTSQTVTRVLPDTTVYVGLQAINPHGNTNSGSEYAVSPLTLAVQDDTLTCAQPMAVLSAQTNIPAQIAWIVGGDTIFSPPVIDFAGPVGVIATDAYGCVVTGQVTVFQDIFTTEDIHVFHDEAAGLLTAFSATPGATFSWTGPGLPEPVSGASIPATLSGLYTVLVTIGDGCTVVLQIEIAVVKTTTPERQDLEVLPNPVDDVLGVKNGTSAPLDLTILDLNGREVLSSGTVAEGSLISFDVAALPAGFYWLRGQGHAGRVVVWKKVVKM